MHNFTVVFRPKGKGVSHVVIGVKAPTTNDALLWGFTVLVAAGWPIEKLGYDVRVKHERP